LWDFSGHDHAAYRFYILAGVTEPRERCTGNQTAFEFMTGVFVFHESAIVKQCRSFYQSQSPPMYTFACTQGFSHPKYVEGVVQAMVV
jgi:hypothetical protein